MIDGESACEDQTQIRQKLRTNSTSVDVALLSCCADMVGCLRFFYYLRDKGPKLLTCQNKIVVVRKVIIEY